MSQIKVTSKTVQTNKIEFDIKFTLDNELLIALKAESNKKTTYLSKLFEEIKRSLLKEIDNKSSQILDKKMRI